MLTEQIASDPSNKDVWCKVYRLLRKVLSNVADHPSEAKFRHINVKKILPRINAARGAVDLLEAHWDAVLDEAGKGLDCGKAGVARARRITARHLKVF